MGNIVPAQVQLLLKRSQRQLAVEVFGAVLHYGAHSTVVRAAGADVLPFKAGKKLSKKGEQRTLTRNILKTLPLLYISLYLIASVADYTRIKHG